MNNLKEGEKYVFVYDSISDEKFKISGCLVNGKERRYKELTFPEANQHARWQLIIKDLEFCESNMTEVLKRFGAATEIIKIDRHNIEGLIFKALIESAVVSYIKCFNQTSGRKVKLEHNELFTKGEGKKYETIHLYVKELRNQAIAHAGISNHEGSSMFAVYDPIPNSNINPLALVAHTNYRVPNIEKLTEFLKLIQYVIKKSEVKLQTKLDSLCQKLIKTPGSYGLEDFTK